MMLPLAQLPEHVVQQIEPFTGPLNWGDIDLRVQRIPSATVAPVHMVMSFCDCYPMNLTAVAMTINNEIFIDPSFADFNTAAGLSLLVHEAVHVRQFSTIPNFLVLYNQANAGVPDEHPWDNVYEMEAYLAECSAFDFFLAQGFPQGAWLPLGKVMRFCG